MDVTTKLHILMVMLGVGITFYMYVLYREVRNFDMEIVDIKKHVRLLMAANPVLAAAVVPQVVEVNLQQQQQAGEPQDDFVPAVIAAPQPSAGRNEEEYVYDNDDDVSVTSNEIKDILTNIKDEDDDEEEVVIAPAAADASSSMPPAAVKAPTETVTTPDLLLASETELQAMKYDDIRNFLRRSGVSTKGTKADYIQKVLGMQQETQEVA